MSTRTMHDRRPNLPPLEKPNGEAVTNAQVKEVFEQAVHNALSFRQQYIRMFTDRRRDIEKECGYPDTSELQALEYRALYERDPIAARVVNILPDSCWQIQPKVYETEDLDEDTEFEKTWVEIAKKLQGTSFFEHKENKGNRVWEYLHRVDRLSGIGHYSVIVLGIDDGKELHEPIELKEDGHDSIKHELLYLRVLDESMAVVNQFEMDQNNPRYGLPIEYTISIEQPRAPHAKSTQASELSKDVKVHWSRVVHIIDNLEASEVYGVSRLRTPYNRLYDLHKLYGGSAEMFWVAAFFGLAFETHPQLGAEVEVDAADMKNQIENYVNSLQRYLAMPGMSVKSIAPQVSDPSAHIEKQIEAICIMLNCPKRIFMGSERGELSSGQDADAWSDAVRCRRNEYLTPMVIVPFIDRLIQVGILPKPESFCVTWEEDEQLTQAEKANVALILTQAMAAYLQGSVENLMDPLDFLTRILGLEEDEAQTVLDNRESTEMPEEELLMDEFGMPIPPNERKKSIPSNREGEEMGDEEKASGDKKEEPPVFGNPKKRKELEKEQEKKDDKPARYK